MEIGITINNAIELCAVCQGISSCYKLIIIIYTGSTDSQFKMVDVCIFKEKLIVWLTMLISSISKFLSKLLHVCKFNLHLIIDMQTFCTILTIQQNTMIQLIKKKKKTIEHHDTSFYRDMFCLVMQTFCTEHLSKYKQKFQSTPQHALHASTSGEIAEIHRK